MNAPTSGRAVPLALLIGSLPAVVPSETPDLPIRGIVHDSRRVRPGSLFVALVGGNTDGHRYIPSAVERGAAAVVGTRKLSDLPLPRLPVPYFQVPDSRLALAHLAAAFYGFPSRQMVMIGVTGTDGKTTTCSLIYSILQAAGLRAGMISTVNAFIGDRILDTGFHVTTPEAPDVQRYLAEMAAAGLTHVVLEATSHGLEQQRVSGCDFDLGVVTNITHEHLDYHGSYAAYRRAKARLFAGLAETAGKANGIAPAAVLNRDDASFNYLAAVVAESNQRRTAGRHSPAVRIVSYGVHPEADIRAEDVIHSTAGLHFTAVGPGFSFPVQSRLAGEYNISNCLAAISATVAGMGLPGEAVQRGIAALAGIPGRMELIEAGQPFIAIVDFAHTPNALRQALKAARQMIKQPRRAPGTQPAGGRVIAVFGSAGLRDREKRRLMAETSAELADLTILTAEDPRTESLESILAEMAAGAEARGGIEGRDFWRIGDRREALRFAVRLAQPGDILMALGKGHEQSMCFGETEWAWDDRTALRAALSELLGVPGPEMPHLPDQPLS